MRRPNGLLAIVLAGVAGVAGCAPAAPSPSASDVGGAGTASPSPSGVASSSPTPQPAGLLAEMDVRHLDPELTDTILEFASDGRSVIFSSGFASDAGREAAPDVWRVRADANDPPERIWRNPHRDHSVVKLTGDLGTIAFVDIPLDGSRAWDLWLIPGEGEEALLLDTHPGDERVSSLVPSATVQEGLVVWTAFDIGPEGPVSQLLWARPPEYEPAVLLERDARVAELWLPSLYAGRVVYTEVAYSDDRTSDDRSVHLLDLGEPRAEPLRLDHSDRAAMPLLVRDTVLWKEADPGFHMLNWGVLWRRDLDGPGPHRLDTRPAEYVNYPSVGSRFVAWWGADAFSFVVYDLLEDRPRVVEAYSAASRANVLRPHISSDLLAWLYVVGEGPGSYAELRYSFMPPLRAP